MGKLLTTLLLLLVMLEGICDVSAAVRREDQVCELTIENGLAGESVSRIIVDHQKQVWIATSNGINRYNGRKLLTYRLPKRQSPSGPSYVFDLCEGDDHAIYAATAMGLFRLGHGESAFVCVASADVSSECVAAGKGCVYFGNKDGLNIYKDGKVKTVTLGRGVNYSVRDIALDSRGKVWFLTKYELNSYDPGSGRIRSLPVAAGMTKGAAFGQLAIIGGKFYLGTKNNGLWAYTLGAPRPMSVHAVGNVITSLQVTRDGKLCVGSDGAGAYLLDGKTGKVLEQYATVGEGQHWLPTDAVYCYLRDDNGVDWMGFYRQGLQYSYHRTPLFKPYAYGNFTTEGVDVRSFLARGREMLIGSRDGLWYVDPARNKVSHFTPEQLGGSHIIMQMEWYAGKYYIAAYDGGLSVLDPQTLRVSKLGLDPLLDLTSVTSLAVSPDNKLWMGTAEGLFILDRSGKLVRYTENNAKLYGGVISDVFFDRHGYGWLSGPKGLALYSPRTRLLSNADFPQGFFNKVSLRSGVRGHGGKLYFVARNEIYYTDTRMKNFGRLQLPMGILEENSYCFIDDMAGHYWLGTENGLFCTPYDGSTMLHLSYSEGLPGRVVYDLRLDGQGRLWLATAGGLLETDPQQVARWQADTLHKVSLYDIYHGENPVTKGQESVINERRSLTLRWNLTAEKLALKLVGDDYARPRGRLYEYRVDGSHRWTMVRDGAEVTIRGLQLGTHELRVRKAGMAGSERIYTITVVPSGWAITELLLLVGGVVLLVMWRRYRQRTRALLDERSEIEQALIEVERQQQLSLEEQELAEATETRKYERVRLDEAECEEIMARVRKYMEEHKPYLDCDYKMSALADTLHISPSKLSQVFNVYLNENYYEFINRYRLAEFKQMIANGDYQRYTLTALSERCGFRRSSFFSTFRKVEGMTPTEFLKKHDISI